MKLSISHVTTYTYDAPVHYALQRLRLIPRSGQGQTVHDWRLTVDGGRTHLAYDDPFENRTELVKVDPGQTRIEITSQGLVEVEDKNGLMGPHTGYAPLWLFREPTALTAAGNNVRQLAARLRGETEGLDDIARMHAISNAIGEAVDYQTGQTDSQTTAEVALSAGQGVCQDHAHIMIAVTRHLGYPACYISGHLLMDGGINQEAGHAWCAVWIEALGWVSFDVSNGICPDDRYVRIATGRDYTDAAPILGIRQGIGHESLQVSLQVQQ